MQRIEVRKSRVLDLVATGLFGFMALGYVYTVVWEKHLAGVGFAILYGGIAALLWRFSPRKPVLIVADEGVTINVPEVGLVPWDEVRGVEYERRNRDTWGLSIYSRLRDTAFVEFSGTDGDATLICATIQREVDRRFAATPQHTTAAAISAPGRPDVATTGDIAVPQLPRVHGERALVKLLFWIWVGYQSAMWLADTFDDLPIAACYAGGVMVTLAGAWMVWRILVSGREIISVDGVRQIALGAGPMIFWGHAEIDVVHGTLLVRSGSRTVRVRASHYLAPADVIPFVEQEVARAKRHLVAAAPAKVS